VCAAAAGSSAAAAAAAPTMATGAAAAAAEDHRQQLPTNTVNLMTETMLGDFESDTWAGYACTFATWTACVQSGCNGGGGGGGGGRRGSSTVAAGGLSCQQCVSMRNENRAAITCAVVGTQTQFYFPAGGIFPVTKQFSMPPHTAIIGAANPTNPIDKALQQTNVSGQTWFVVPRDATLCGGDPLCKGNGAKGRTACSGDPSTHRQGFLMSSGSMLKNINFQGADLGRAAIEGTLCGPGVIELPGCVSGTGCERWGDHSNGHGVVRDVTIENVRLSDAVKRPSIAQMRSHVKPANQQACNRGEALDVDGNHVPAHQVSVWVAKLPNSETGSHSNIVVDNLVSMASRADGFNVHGAVTGLILQNSHIENSGDDCVGIWSAGIKNMTIRAMTAKNCAVMAGVQTNWGSCMGTYAFQALSVEGLACYDPFLNATGCNPRTHWSAIHINKAFANDCMPEHATLSLAKIEYVASEAPDIAIRRPKCAQCKSCCGKCSPTGFAELAVEYLDDSVPQGSCKTMNAGC
jgi:hypothetical protein